MIKITMIINTIIGPFDVVMGHSQGACLTIAMDALRRSPGNCYLE